VGRGAGAPAFAGSRAQPLASQASSGAAFDRLLPCYTAAVAAAEVEQALQGGRKALMVSEIEQEEKEEAAYPLIHSKRVVVAAARRLPCVV